MDYKEACKKVAQENQWEASKVEEVYKAFWLFIRSYITKLPLQDNLTEEAFNKLKTNFNIPHLGKLCCTWEQYVKLKRKYEKVKENKTDVYKDSDDC